MLTIKCAIINLSNTPQPPGAKLSYHIVVVYLPGPDIVNCTVEVLMPPGSLDDVVPKPMKDVK